MILMKKSWVDENLIRLSDEILKFFEQLPAHFDYIAFLNIDKTIEK
jgi:hypothetical protein